MSEVIILADGTEREVPTEDEIKESSFRSEERKKQREELKQQNEELKDGFSKLANKDLNFSKLKKQTKEKEEEIAKKAEEVEEAQKVFVGRQTDEYQQDALNTLNLDDKEKEKVLHCYNNELTTKAVTKNEIMDKMGKAYKLAINPAKYNPINTASNYMGRETGEEKKSESDTSKEMRQRIFKTGDDDAKKYGKGWQPKF